VCSINLIFGDKIMNQEISKKEEKSAEKGTWLIRDAYTTTKRIIKAYAAEEGVSIADALKIIVEEWKAQKKA
jgi:hypothetical protein